MLDGIFSFFLMTPFIKLSRSPPFPPGADLKELKYLEYIFRYLEYLLNAISSDISDAAMDTGSISESRRKLYMSCKSPPPPRNLLSSFKVQRHQTQGEMKEGKFFKCNTTELLLVLIAPSSSIHVNVALTYFPSLSCCLISSARLNFQNGVC